MTPYPVTYHVEHPARFTRLQLLLRLVAFVLLGMLGVSLGLVYFVAWVGLAIFAAARLSGAQDPDAYLRDDGPRILRLLRWYAAISAWFGLVADRFPTRSPAEVVDLQVRPLGRPPAGNALLRLLLGLPSLIVLAILCCVGSLVGFFAALSILFRERVADWAFDYLAGLQRFGVRVLAYQASLVDVYPPFTMEEDELVARPLAS